MKTFSIREAVSFGWKTFWSRPWLYVGAGALLFCISVVFSVPEELLSYASKMTTGGVALALVLCSLMFTLLHTVVNIFIGMGETHFFLTAHDAPEKVQLKDLFYVRSFWSYVGTSILGLFAVILGFILLIIPGIIAALATTFSLFLVIDKQLKPVSALKESWRITKGHWWKLLLFFLCLLGINLLGFLALVIGLVVTIPVSFFASVYIYRLLSKETDVVSVG